MTKKIIYLLLYFFISNCYSQNQKKIDSLKLEIDKYISSQEYKSNLSKKDTLEVGLLLKLAKEFYGYDNQKQLYFANKALVAAKRINYEKGIAKSYSLIGLANNFMGNFEIAIQNYNAAIVIYKRLKMEDDIAINIYYSGSSYLFQGNLPKALEKLNDALKKFEKLNNKLQIATIYNNIGILYSKQNRKKEVIKYYQKALSVLENSTQKKEIGFRNVIYLNLAVVYCNDNENQKSLDILRPILPLMEKEYTDVDVADVVKIIGKNHLLMQQNDKALTYFFRGLNIYIKNGNKSNISDLKRYIGQAYLQKNDYNKAIKYTEEALSLSKEIGEIESVKFCYDLLHKIYNKHKDHKKAYENLLLYKKTSDSLFNSEVNNKVTQIQMTYEFEKKQKAREEIQRKKEALLKEETQKQRNIKYTVSAILIIVSFFTFWIYKNLKRNQKQKKIIENQNAVIQQSLSEKEVLLREIHHRVKNNLQIVSSILSIQTQNINDESVLAAMEEGQSRVQAMSLIHENLYQSEHINNVNINNYLQELIQYLSTMYEKDSKQISVEIKAKDVYFDIDTAIPLGLIVNELISNAYKYAFKDKMIGNIWIVLERVNEIEYCLKVIDNGNALPENFDLKKIKSMGLTLVSKLSKQLQGNFTMQSNNNNKTIFNVSFKDLKL